MCVCVSVESGVKVSNSFLTSFCNSPCILFEGYLTLQ